MNKLVSTTPQTASSKVSFRIPSEIAEKVDPDILTLKTQRLKERIGVSSNSKKYLILNPKNMLKLLDKQIKKYGSK